MAGKNGWKRVAECIYRRGDTYQVRLNNPQTGRKETFGPTDGVVDRESAFRVRDQMRADMRRGRQGSQRETIGRFLERWLHDFPRQAATTNKHYREQADPFVRMDAHEFDPDEFVEGTRVGDLTFDQFSRKMARRYAQKEPSRARAVSAMFTDAVQDGSADVNPFHRLGFRRTGGRKELVVISREELDLLARCARDEHGEYGEMFEAMVLTLAWTGMRPGELFVLRWSDIDWQTDTITIRRSYRSKTNELVDYTKTGGQRKIVMAAPLREHLRRVQAAHDPSDRPGGEEDNCFATKRGVQFYAVAFGYYWQPVRAAFEAVVRQRDPGRAKLLFERANGTHKPMDPYELRHFCATYLLEKGVPAHQVAVQLGHKDNGALVLSTYGHPSEDAARDAVRAAFGA